VGMAAAVCRKLNRMPRGLTAPDSIVRLQQDLLRSGQHIPHHALDDANDLARSATISASSELALEQFEPNGPWLRLDDSWAMVIAAGAGAVPKYRLQLECDEPTALRCELRACSRVGSFTPDSVLAYQTIALGHRGAAVPRPHLASRAVGRRLEQLAVVGGAA